MTGNNQLILFRNHAGDDRTWNKVRTCSTVKGLGLLCLFASVWCFFLKTYPQHWHAEDRVIISYWRKIPCRSRVDGNTWYCSRHQLVQEPSRTRRHSIGTIFPTPWNLRPEKDTIYARCETSFRRLSIYLDL